MTFHAIRAAEFFAGIGLMRTALDPLGVDVVWANDIEPMKAKAYLINFPQALNNLVIDDICKIEGGSLPHDIELATASFPCVDVSIAGNRQGIYGKRSGLFWQFLRIIGELPTIPKVILLENVRGLVSSNDGKDLRDMLHCLSEVGYSSDIISIDSRHFVPQSRQRIFIVGIAKSVISTDAIRGIPPISDVRPRWIVGAHAAHRRGALMHYVNLPMLPTGPADLSTVIERDAPHADWWEKDRVRKFVDSLSSEQRSRFEALRRAGTVSFRTAYRRTRHGVAVWEVRRDGISGCLRTTSGGSSRQALIELGRDNDPRIRWMTPREYAKLMGAPDYRLLAGTPNQQLFGLGDAVVVDVVRWVGQHYLLHALRPTFRKADNPQSHKFKEFDSSQATLWCT